MNPYEKMTQEELEQVYQDFLNESAEPEEEEDWSVDVRDEPSHVVPA